jgi:hypothetical protein
VVTDTRGRVHECAMSGTRSQSRKRGADAGGEEAAGRRGVAVASTGHTVAKADEGAGAAVITPETASDAEGGVAKVCVAFMPSRFPRTWPCHIRPPRCIPPRWFVSLVTSECVPCGLWHCHSSTTLTHTACLHSCRKLMRGSLGLRSSGSTIDCSR